MRLLRLRVRDFKGLPDREVRFGPGITLILGPNESGKSTLAEALRVLFDDKVKHTSKAASIRALQPAGKDVGPEAELELQAGPYHLVYRKTFLKRPAVELEILAPRADRLSGDEAIARFHELLGSEEVFDAELFRALWVEQGGTLTGLGELTGGWLRAALDRAAGGSGDGGEHASLLERAARELERYYSLQQGKERKELEEARRVRAEAAATVEQTRRRWNEIERAAQDHERALREIRTLQQESEASAIQRRKREEELQRARTRASEIREGLQRLEHDAEKLRSAEEALERRRGLLRRIAERTAAVTEGRAELERREEHRTLLEAEVRTRRSALASAEAQLEATRTLVRERERDREWFAAAMRAEELRAILDELRTKVERVREHRGAARPALGDEAFAAARRAQRALEDLERGLREEGTQVELRAERALSVEWNDALRQLEAGERLAGSVGTGFVLDLPGELHLRVRAARSDAERMQELERARRALQLALQPLGVVSIAEAEELERQLIQIRARLEAAERELREALRTRGARGEEAEQTLGRLEGELAAAVERREELARSRPAEAPRAESEDRARTALEEAREALALAEAQVRSAREALTAAEKGLAREERELATLQERSAQLERALRDDEAALQVEREAVGDTELEALLAELGSQRAQRQQRTQSLQEELESQDLGTLEELLEVAGQAVDRCARELGAAKEARSAAEAILRHDEGAGLGERLEIEEAALSQAQERLASVERRARAARLLHDTLQSCHAAEREAYRRPLEERMASLGRHVFGPDFEVVLAEDLSIAERILGGVRLPFAQLSGGAREQLDSLLRIAVARLVADRGGVPLLFDDTLGNSDPERVRSLNGVLSLAGRELQVLVLTCHPERFAALGEVEKVRLGEGESP